MPTEMPLGLPFVVDTWGSSSRRRRHHHFLTHAHTDHLANAQAYPGDTIYATRLTMRLALLRVRQVTAPSSIYQIDNFDPLERGVFVEMELGKRLVVRDPDGDFSVTAYDANHCPGAAMFLFEGPFGKILHTGDCRLTSNFVQNLPLKVEENNCRLDNVYLDCTFSEFPMFPSKELAIQQVIACILKHPHAPFVYLHCERLGHEEILLEVSRAFGSKIYLDRGWNLDYFDTLSLTVPEIITVDPTCRFQIVGRNQFKEIKETKLEERRASRQPDSLLIRPSTMWYANAHGQNQKLSLTEAEQDDSGVWHICFSIHSSRDELEQALQILQPQWVISTTPPNFANELNYV
ncbi:5' exonuclease Apollo-like, partial [Lolium rigidum]|uniref:5' exonuclease Apollo-like n=1 Tax=Lolium rigidum TaxID=89674 RepID=UPI001F5DC197